MMKLSPCNDREQLLNSFHFQEDFPLNIPTIENTQQTLKFISLEITMQCLHQNIFFGTNGSFSQKQFSAKVLIRDFLKETLILFCS